jgi:outer membrane protein OmpA-like peptidoglycan-associated protein
MRFVLPALIAAALPVAALAQEAPISETTPEALIEALTPTPVFRGIKVTEVAPPSVDLAVEFAYDSAELSDAAMALLATLAGALGSDQLQGYRFSVAGHTDAAGSDQYNLQLSLARAQSVQTFLSQVHGIAPERLDVLGYGETRLLYPDAPEDGRNRRVEISTLE